jgi:hypothetical protein
MTAVLTPYSDTSENRKRLLDFYRLVYPTAPWIFEEKRWAWQTFGNPRLAKGSNDIWLLTDDNGEMIGHNVFLRYPLRIGGKPYDGLCSANLVVKPGITGRGLGRMMIQKNEELGGVPFAIGMTDNSYSAFGKRGWYIVHHIRLYSQIVHPWPNLKYLKLPLWKAVLALPFLLPGKTLSSLYAATVPKSFAGITTREIESFDPALDSLWNSFLGDYAFYFERTAEMLNYKFATRTDVRHTRLLFEKNGKVVGYGICRISENPVRKIRMGRIVDLVLDPSLGDSFAVWVVGYMRRHLLAEGVDGLAGLASSDCMKRAYRRNGFWFSRVERSGIKETDFSMAELARQYADQWYMTLADADLDDYW